MDCCRSNLTCVTCRYAYMEYATETAAVEAAKKYQDVELGGNKLYVIKSMIERMMSFGETAFIVTCLFCSVLLAVYELCR